MRRTLYLAPLAVTALVVAAFSLSQSPAQPRRGPENPGAVARSTPPALPIQQVVLFSSGVGYFQREGEVEGNTRVDLSFPVQDINDLLKSMVLQDLGGGQVTAVSYDSRDPVQKTLQGFAVNLTNNPGFGQILTQARGEKVEVVMQPGAANGVGTLTGEVIGVERQRQAAGKEPPVEVEMLNLWCPDGMRSVRLAEVQRIHFLNPVMESEFKRALQVLASSHDSQKKAVSLTFTGEGKRPVRVGYVVENPIWKTSYRLVLGKNDQPLLQGWAVVENPTDEDWTNVRMTLVSGRPISFQMDLYQPLYVPRPVVQPELFASLSPQAYSGGMMGGAGGPLPVAGVAGVPYSIPKSEAPAAAPAPGAKERELAEQDKAHFQRSLGAIPRLRGAPAGGMAPGAPSGAVAADEPANYAAAISAAQGTELGDYFEYAIAKPVSLPRRKSALFPIVNQDVRTSRVSIYNAVVHEKFPLLGLKLKNTTGLHLMQGPVTVFEGASYAGDARIMDLQPKEERLLSYAIDLGTEVEVTTPEPANRLTNVKIVKGILLSTTKVRQTKVYNVKNRSEHDRDLIIEHPYRQEFKLVSEDKPAEHARDVYRFELKVPAGKTGRRELTEEQDVIAQMQLTNADDPTLRVFLNSQVVSPRVKEALERAAQFKNKLAGTQREVAEVERQLKAISDDQGRLRANLKEMPPTAAAYKRYLEKFDAQETEIERLQARVKKLQETEHQERKEYETFLANLNIG